MHPNQGNHLSKEAFTKCKLNWMIQPLKLWFKATGADNKREPVLKCCKAIVRDSFHVFSKYFSACQKRIMQILEIG